MKRVNLPAGLRTMLLSGAAIMFPSEAVWAQAAPLADQPSDPRRDDQSDESRTILVTGTRIQRSGFDQPTPTTIVSEEELRQTAVVNPADYLNLYVPSFSATITPSTDIVQTLRPAGNSPDLRGLGAQRTLVLVDGRRHIGTSPTGTVDIDVIPSALIDRIDIVTGGASAAYGSDAVAGVVNLVFKRDYEGFDALAQYGISSRGDNAEYRLSAAYGALLFDDRINVMVGADYVEREGIPNQGDREWGRQGYQVVTASPPTSPQRQVYSGVNRIATAGGLIINTPLRGTQFGAGGTILPFEFGTQLTGGFNAVQQGGGGEMTSRDISLRVPSERWNVFGRVTFDLTDSMTAYAEASYARSSFQDDLLATGDGIVGTPPYTVFRDNGFLPAPILTQMLALNIDAFSLARVDYDLGYIRVDNENRTQRYVAGITGEIGGGWSWDVYWQHGRNTFVNGVLDNRNTGRWAAAADSILLNGQQACRSAVARAAGCVPIDLFGPGPQSQAVLDFINQDIETTYHLRQTVVAASMQGELFSTWAGPVAVAFGAEYREDDLIVELDPDVPAIDPATGLPPAYLLSTSGFSVDSASLDVKEAFAEVVVPLASETPFLHRLEVNGAFRYTDYSLSGGVSTWKLGAVWEPIPDIQFRGTRSRDIRAPNALELFTVGSQSLANITDPVLGISYQIPTNIGGNPNLVPETANTLTYGVVLQPRFAQGLRMSIDAYRIKLSQAIARLQAQALIDLCAAGTAGACSPIVRDPATNLITEVFASYVNLQNIKIAGIDFELSYRRPLADLVSSWSGNLNLRLLVNHTYDFENDSGVDFTGSLGQNTASGIGSGAGIPEWRGTATLGYDNGGFTAALNARYVGSGEYNANLPPNVFDSYRIGAETYIDLSLAYALPVREGGDGQVQLFANIRNLFDNDPPIVPRTSVVGHATNTNLYDVMGRMFIFGARVRF